MTDAVVPGAAPIEAPARETDDGAHWFARWIDWQFKTRLGLVLVWLIFALTAMAGALLWHFYRAPFLQSSEHKAGLAALSVLAYLPAMLLLLDSRDNLSKGPRPPLSIATMLSLAGLVGWIYADQYFGLRILSAANTPVLTTIVVAGFFAYLASVFVAPIWNAANFARYDAERREQREEEIKAQAAAKAQSEADALGRVVVPEAAVPELSQKEAEETRDAEAMGALVATLTILLIGALAYAAGDGAALSLQSRFGLVLSFVVIGVFAAVVLLDVFAELAPVRWLASALEWISRRSYWLAAFYNWIDTGLVRIGAHVAGMGHRSLFMRYLVLTGTLGALCLLAWGLPPPLGLVPAFLVFALAISVSRLWSWVEEDRALAAMTEYRVTAPYRTDLREDFKDETLLGFIFVFLVAPIAMMQAHNGGVFGAHLFANAEDRSFADWFGFFGIELAKAIPIVDWAEIYGVDTSTDMIAINGAASRHAVFIARVMVDLVLIASLAQAIGVWTRNRQQKELYRNKHIYRLDPFVERVELGRAIRGVRVVGDDGKVTFELSRLRSDAFVDFRRYLDAQIRQIYGSTRDADTRGFIEAIATQRNMELAHPIELAVGEAEGRRDEEVLFRTFHLALAEHDAHVKSIEPDDLYRILTGLRTTQGLSAFKQKVIDTLCHIAEPQETVDILSGLAGGEKGDRFQYARNHMIKAMARAARRMNDANAVKAVRAEVRRIARLRSSPHTSAVRAAISMINARLRKLGVRVRGGLEEE